MVVSANYVIPLLLMLVTGQRLLELVIARRNTKRLLAAGGYEVGQKHYPLIIILHASWLATLWCYWLLGYAQLRLAALFSYLLVQPLRLWVMSALGRFWTTRVIVLPNVELVQRGPYRWFRHPNYMIVVLEMALLPLSLGAAGPAILFSVCNAVVLIIRLRVETASLQPRRHLPSAMMES